MQGVSGELQAKLVSSMAYAAGRYGHVIFPENAHQPALDLAEKLLSGVGRGWADRVFFSDNGSVYFATFGLQSQSVAQHDAFLHSVTCVLARLSGELRKACAAPKGLITCCIPYQ